MTGTLISRCGKVAAGSKVDATKVAPNAVEVTFNGARAGVVPATQVMAKTWTVRGRHRIFVQLPNGESFSVLEPVKVIARGLDWHTANRIRQENGGYYQDVTLTTE